MAHHGQETGEIGRIIRQTFAKQGSEPGPTGKFPRGKIDDEADEGELDIAVLKHKGEVVLALGHPVSWVAWAPAEAIQLGHLLIQHGKQAANGLP